MTLSDSDFPDNPENVTIHQIKNKNIDKKVWNTKVLKVLQYFVMKIH